MPTATIQMPTGQIVTLEVPEGATEQDIWNFIATQDLSQYASPSKQPDIGTITNGRMYVGDGSWRDVGSQYGGVRSALQGMTFGLADEIGAGIAAIPASIATDESYGDVYRKMLDRLGTEQSAYREEHPLLSTGLEMAGGMATGIAGAGKFAGSKAGQAIVQHTPRWLQAAGLGATEGGIYGAATARPGERMSGGLTGAAVGGVAAPVIGGVAAGIGHGGRVVSRWLKRRISDTPRKKVIRVMREALANEGLDPDEAVALYEKLGSEGMLIDLGENFRAVAKAAVDIPGPAKAIAKKRLYDRQMGQGQRLMEHAERLIGKRAADLPFTTEEIISRRLSAAEPIYQAAYAQGIEMTDKLAEVLGRDGMKTALRLAKRLASNFSDSFDVGSLKHLHYAKMALYDQIRRAPDKLARSLKKVYGDLLDAIGEQNQTYLRANAIWSDESKLLDAALLGKEFFRMTPSQMADDLGRMAQGERELFQMGALAAFQDLLDSMQTTHDATRKLVGSEALRKKMQLLFGEGTEDWITGATNEREFLQSLRWITGGSPTSPNLAGQKWLGSAIQPETLTAVASGDPMGIALSLARQLIPKDQPPSPEVLQSLGNVLLTKGMRPEQVRKIFESPAFLAALEKPVNPLVPRAAAGIAAPILHQQQER